MDKDPFNRVPETPIVRREAPSVATDPGDQKFVPAFALERGPGADPNTFNVITAILASGGTFVQKTGCNSGTPYTYYAPEWTSNPTP